MLFVEICIIHTVRCKFTTSYSLSPVFFPFHFISVLLNIIFQFFVFLYLPSFILYLLYFLLCRKVATTLCRTYTHFKLCSIHCLVETLLAFNVYFECSRYSATVCINTLAVQRDWSTKGEL
jgi:hypothetical protein